jgi:hypothetical protein
MMTDTDPVTVPVAAGNDAQAAEQAVLAGNAVDASAAPDGKDQPSASGLARQRAEQPWVMGAGKLVRLALLAGAGAGLRVLIAPGAGIAAAAWLILTAAGTAWLYLRWARAGEPVIPAAAWRPGDPLPDWLPPATAEAAGRMLARIPSRRWRGAWLEAARCTDPVRHGKCRTAATIPAGNMIRVVLGEHLAERPQVAAFSLAHESRHPAGWTCHLSVFANWAQMAAWLTAGWAVPWPWLLAVLAVIQVAHEAVCWAVEISCDMHAARAEGPGAALEAFAWYLAMIREPAPGPAWHKHARRVIVAMSGLAPHPPARLRRALVRVYGRRDGAAA